MTLLAEEASEARLDRVRELGEGAVEAGAVAVTVDWEVTGDGVANGIRAVPM